MHRTTNRFTSLGLAVAMGVAGLLGTGCGDENIVAVSAEIQLQENPIEFGEVMKGFSSTKYIQVENTGSAKLKLANPAGGAFLNPGSNWSDAFTVSMVDNITEIIPGAVAQLKVVFRPDEAQEYNESIVLYSNAEENGALTINLHGIGVPDQINIVPERIDFGPTVENTIKEQEVVISNDGTTDTIIVLKPIRNDNEDAFSITPNVTPDQDGQIALPAGDRIILTARFAPTRVPGDRESPYFTAEFDVEPCPGGCGAKTVRMQGEPVDNGFICGDAEGNSSLDFGAINPGSCLEKLVICRNVANVDVPILKWEALNTPTPTSPDFQIEEFDNSTNLVLHEGESFDISVTYCPQELGQDTGTVVVEQDINDPTKKYALVPLLGRGGGPDIEAVPQAVSFGMVSTLAPGHRRVAITNAGYDILTITNVTIEGADPAAFATNGAVALMSNPYLNQGEQRILDITFAPTEERDFSAQVIIESNDVDEARLVIDLAGTGLQLPPCEYETVPTSGVLQFGVVEAGRSMIREFQIHNIGSDQCLISGVELDQNSHEAFSLADEDLIDETTGGVLIDADEYFTVPILYAPNASGDHEGWVNYYISTENATSQRVQLVGSSGEACLMVIPNELDFGNIPAPQDGVACTSQAKTVSLYNACGSSMEVANVAFDEGTSPEYQMVTPLSTPVTIAVGTEATFDVTYSPNGLGRDAGAIRVDAHPSGAPTTAYMYMISMTGQGTTDASQEDIFIQLDRPEVDILFVIDNSGSMGQEQQSLANNFAAFINFAIAQNLDYHIAVTTTDVTGSGEQGRFVGQAPNNVVTPNTMPSPQDVFQQLVDVGTVGSATECGFEAAYRALSTNLLQTTNANFLRQDAYLSIIFISDEHEQSDPPVDFYVNYFLNIKGFRNTNLFSASAIVGPLPDGCSSPSGDAVHGQRYIEAVDRTGGVFESICTQDWAASLENLGLNVFGYKSRFFLSNAPIVTSIQVYIDGAEMPMTGQNGGEYWRYDGGTNSVNFSPMAIPEPGAEIRVTYDVACL